MILNSNRYSDGFFNVSVKNGFLPTKDPLTKPPEYYEDLNIITDNLHKYLKDGSIQDLAENLPNYIEEVKLEEDVFVLGSLYRSYCFLSSGYLLEPAQKGMINGVYGKARNHLPKNIAEPFEYVANKLKVFPFLDYHYAYSLGNYVKKDKDGDLNWENLDMAVSFSGGNNEAGFIMLHVDINRNSPNLIKSIELFQSGKIKEALQLNLDTMININNRRCKMWSASDSKRYNDFRCYIMGIKGNEIFGDGVTYGDDTTPRLYRGQTGAQDDIIPTEDIFIGVVDYYPRNRLTKYLLELREYRPKCVQEFHRDLFDSRVDMLNLLEGNDEVKMILLKIIVEIYKFRHGHWMFVQRYIMRNTKYATATGGTPIISWLPNQILAVLNYMEDVIDSIEVRTEELDRLEENYDSYREVIEKQMKDMKILVESNKLYEKSLEIQREDLDKRYV